MHKKCHNPRNQALSNDNRHCPFSSQLPLDRSNCGNTRCIYKSENTKSAAAVSGVIAARRFAVSPNRIDKVDTTLSFAINPVMSAVEIRQSPNPRGANTGAISPAAAARRLSYESVTTFKCKSKVCKNQMIIVARKIMVNALCKKSFAFSHRSCATFFAPGIR